MNLDTTPSHGVPLTFSVTCPKCQQKTGHDLRPAGGTTTGDSLFRHSCGKTITISPFQALDAMSISQQDARRASEFLMAGKSFSETRRLTLLSQPKLECLEYLHDDGLEGLLRVLNASLEKRQAKTTSRKASKKKKPKTFDRQTAAEYLLQEVDARHGLQLHRTQVVGDVIEAALKQDRDFFNGFRLTEASLEMGVPREVILARLKKAHWSLKPRSK
ncbi:MAG: hypothetical protein K0U98_11405 [Deltaproteobacteria bacterium]|nr:hypothetical protein [Deltaproteobacteria bacterium]